MTKDRFLRALRRQAVDCTPIWMMRQAGRFLPEYRATRARAGDFLTLCKTPELACEVTLQPVQRFPLDAAIIFSDILTIPDAMGLGLTLKEGEGPRFQKPVRHEEDVRQLFVPDPETELCYVMDAIRLAKTELQGRVPLIGFTGSPWTLATYMVEGRSSRDFKIIKTMLYDRPGLLQQLLTVVTDAVIQYLKAQAAAGVQAIMIFDTWGGVLAHQEFLDFSLQPMQRIVAAVKASYPRIPVIVFAKGGGQWLPALARTGCDALGLDWTCSLQTARKITADKVALQGNLDPTVLYASPEAIRQQVAAVLADFGDGPGHVFNLGHGVNPDTDPDRAAVLIEAVHEQSRRYHQHDG